MALGYCSWITVAVALLTVWVDGRKICRDCGSFGYCIRNATHNNNSLASVDNSKNSYYGSNYSYYGIAPSVRSQYSKPPYTVGPAGWYYGSNTSTILPLPYQNIGLWQNPLVYHNQLLATTVIPYFGHTNVTVQSGTQPWSWSNQFWWPQQQNYQQQLLGQQSYQQQQIFQQQEQQRRQQYYQQQQQLYWQGKQQKQQIFPQQWQQQQPVYWQQQRQQQKTEQKQQHGVDYDSGDGGEYGGCAQCACPPAVGGACCEDVPDICSEVDCVELMRSPAANSSAPPPRRATADARFSCRQLSAAQNFYECVCAPEFAGPRCEQPVDACALCSAPGTRKCRRGQRRADVVCECRDGFIGRYCEGKMFEFCADGECACNEPDNVGKGSICANGGVCFYNGTADYFCRCADGFTGPNCHERVPCGPAHKNPCQHGGICVPRTEDNGGAANYTCQCPEIWRGEHCEEFDACAWRPRCRNGGHCMPTGHDSFRCDCTGTGFIGELCQENIDDCVEPTDVFADTGKDSAPRRNKCQRLDANATCTDGVNAFTCECSPQFRGSRCDVPVTTWTFLQNFPDVTESDLVQFMEMIAAAGDASLARQVLPFLTSDVEQAAFSWTHEDLFVWAAFQGRELNVTNEFAVLNDPLFGNCFTFNHADTPQTYMTSGAGSDNGFEALLRVREDEYLQWTATAGVALFFHSRDERIFTDSPRYYAAPQTATQFAISKGCIQSCYQNALHLICGCTDPRYPGIDGVADCTLAKGACVLNITLTLGDPSEWEACECAAPCNKTDFQVDVRAARLVSSSQRNNTADSIHISVYFAKDYLLRYNELASMDFNRYISFFGGVVGVVAGFSVISVVEFGFLVYRLLLTFCTNESVSLDEAEVQDADDDIVL